MLCLRGVLTLNLTLLGIAVAKPPNVCPSPRDVREALNKPHLIERINEEQPFNFHMKSKDGASRLWQTIDISISSKHPVASILNDFLLTIDFETRTTQGLGVLCFKKGEDTDNALVMLISKPEED